MYLRSGAYIKSGSRSVVSEGSRVYTEGSVNQTDHKPLTAILEDESDSSLEQSYRVMTSFNVGVDMVNDSEAIGTSNMSRKKLMKLLYAVTTTTMPTSIKIKIVSTTI